MMLSQEEYQKVFVQTKAITQAQFDGLSQTKEARQIGLDRVLVARGILTEREVGQLMSIWFEVPFVDLGRTEIHSEDVALLPEVFARAQEALVIGQTPTQIRVATTDPRNSILASQLKKFFRREIVFVYATGRDLQQHYFLYQADPESRLRAIIDREQVDTRDMDMRATDFVSTMIDIAYQRRVSDIHLEPEEEYVLLRYREDGILHDIVQLPVDLEENILTRIKVLSRLATDEHRKAQDGKISYKTPWGNDVEIRVSIVPTTHQEKAVLRLLTDQTQAFSLPELGFSPEDYTKISNAAHKPWGMILATGPTGSGKTTTLYALLQLLNEREVNITTIEDPVEVDLDGVSQIQVNERTGLTFAKGLRSIVRQDPDIIMVGEIRDGETADIAVNAAMTGHLVLSTLHTNDAATTFVRLVDLGVDAFLIASTVNIVVAQRLVRKVCIGCIQSLDVNVEQELLFERFPQAKNRLLKMTGKNTIKDLQLFAGKGCKVCHMTGYHGRVGIFEVLEVTDEIRDALMTHKNADQIGVIAREQGMHSMVEDGLRKVLVGQTTIEEVFRVSQLDD